MGKKRAFSLYDVEQFIREAGAEKVNEKAVLSLEQELEDMARELVAEAQTYANYAGRTKLIKYSDVRLVNRFSRGRLKKLWYISARKSRDGKVAVVKTTKKA